METSEHIHLIVTFLFYISVFMEYFITFYGISLNSAECLVQFSFLSIFTIHGLVIRFIQLNYDDVMMIPPGI